MVCGLCHANVSRSSHELQGYTFGLQPDLIQDSGGFCQIVSSQTADQYSSASQGRVLTPRPFFFVPSFCAPRSARILNFTTIGAGRRRSNATRLALSRALLFLAYCNAAGSAPFLTHGSGDKP